VWSEARQKVILWWTATPGACCDAYWGVAESSDGIHFDLISLNETGADHLHASALSQQQQPPPQQQQQQQPARRRRPRLQSSMLGDTAGVVNPKDGNAVLIDDDGVGYIAYTAMAPFGKLPNGTLKPGPAGPHGHPAGFKGDHMVAIERLTPVRKMPFSGRDVPSENLEFAKTGSRQTHEERIACFKSQDLRQSTKVQIGRLFPDDFVEGVMIFKRKGTYYIIYSSCCCASRYGKEGNALFRVTFFVKTTVCQDRLRTN
jgi:hypothetical protein